MKKTIASLILVFIAVPSLTPVLGYDKSGSYGSDFAQPGTSVGTTPAPATSQGSTPAPATSNGSTPAPKTSTGSTPPETVMGSIPNPLKVNSISGLFYDVIDFIISLSYVVIAFFFLLSGFKFVTAQGSEDKLNEAKRTFFNTVIGALVIVGANTIVAVVRSIIENLQK